MLFKAHQGMAYLITLLGFVNVALALSVAKNPVSLATFMMWSHRIVLFAGRLTLLLGLALSFERKMGFHPLEHWWMWSGLLIWGGFEVAAKRMVSPELACAKDGAETTNRLLIGLLIELVVIGTIFGLMFLK